MSISGSWQVTARAYAVFHSPTYRARYVEFLKSDFPHLPLTSNLKLFKILAEHGRDLVAFHLLQAEKVADLITEFPVKGTNEIENSHYTDNDQRVWINEKQYFSGVPKAVWESHVGGYQVCARWLADRKGEKLTYADIQHYQQTVVAINETTLLMLEIDADIEKLSGWPIK